MQIDNFFLWFLKTRYRIYADYKISKSIRHTMKQKIAYAFVLGMSAASIFLSILSLPAPYGRLIAALIISLVIFAVYVLVALQSCQTLCILWCMLFVVSFFFAKACAIDVAEFYWLCVAITALLWCGTSGLANYDTAKLAALIMNTVSTVFVLAVNVSAMYPELFWMTEEQIADFQFAVNIGIFPFTAAGYFVALFKEIQVYWEEHRGKNKVKNTSGLIEIRKQIYSLDEEKSAS